MHLTIGLGRERSYGIDIDSGISDRAGCLNDFRGAKAYEENLKYMKKGLPKREALCAFPMRLNNLPDLSDIFDLPAGLVHTKREVLSRLFRCGRR